MIRIVMTILIPYNQYSAGPCIKQGALLRNHGFQLDRPAPSMLRGCKGAKNSYYWDAMPRALGSTEMAREALQ